MSEIIQIRFMKNPSLLHLRPSDVILPDHTSLHILMIT